MKLTLVFLLLLTGCATTKPYSYDLGDCDECLKEGVSEKAVEVVVLADRSVFLCSRHNKALRNYLK